MKIFALILVLLFVSVFANDDSQEQEHDKESITTDNATGTRKEESEEANEVESEDPAEKESDANETEGSGIEEEEEEDEAAKRADTMQTNIGYLFRGYSLLEGNPLDPNTFDPGFKTKIFEATYDQNKKTDDQRHSIPDNIDVLAKETCSSSFTSETITSQADYQRSLSAKASVSGSAKFKIVDAAFSASSEYTRMSKKMKSNTKSVIRSEATCTIYEATVQTGTPPKFTDNFLTTVKLMGEKPDYGRFLDTFGTHFVETVDMGARFTKLQVISKEKKEELQKQGIDIKTTASVSAAPIGKLETSGGVTVSKEQTDKFEASVEETKIVTIGSKPPTDGTKDAWITKAIVNPLPTAYSLVSITELFGPSFFKPESGVDHKKIKKELLEYLKGYCTRLKTNRLPGVECEGPPKGCKGGSQCSVYAICKDDPSSKDIEQQYDCSCKPGYKGDGRICMRSLKSIPGKILQHDSVIGSKGTWGGMESCENGIFANGFLLRAEKDKDATDDTGANAVCIKCDNEDICSKMGPWGDWSSPPFMCPEDSFLTGWRQNVQAHKGWGMLRDDTELDNVEYKCRDLDTWEERKVNMKGQAKEWGNWSKFKECPRGQFICGINTRVADPGGDDTALNDIKHQCCKPILDGKKSKK